MPAFDATGWTGFVVPAGTPREVIGRLNREIVAAARAKEYADYVAHLGAEVIAGSPADFGQFIETEIERWKQIAKEANVRLD